MTAVASGSKTPSVLKIKRQDTPTGEAYWQTFSIPYKRNMNITSVLQVIAGNPVKAEGKKTSPLNYDAACLEEVCGSCTMVINGKARQACSALIDHIRTEHGDGEIVIEPMSKFPIVRDLMVDRTRMFENLKRIKGWVPVDGYYNQGAGPKIDPAAQDEMWRKCRACMTCRCCLEACPQCSPKDNTFVGAQVLSQVEVFQHASDREGGCGRAS